MLVHENNKNKKSGEKGQSDIGKRLWLYLTITRGF